MQAREICIKVINRVQVLFLRNVNPYKWGIRGGVGPNSKPLL